LGTLGAILGVIVVVTGLLVWAIMAASVEALRWWAATATFVALIALGVGVPAAFALGRYGATERIRGMDTAIDKIAGVATRVVDLRGQTAVTMRRSVETPAEPVPPPEVTVTHRNERPSLPSGNDFIEL